MKMPKSKPPTMAEAKAGAVTDEWSEFLVHMMETLAPDFRRIANNVEAWETEATALFNALHDADLSQAEKYIIEHPPSAGAIAFLILVTQDKFKSEQATRGAYARHSKPGGSHEKARQIRTSWASGKFSSRDICAEQECAALGMSFSAARKALRGTPDPT